MSKDTRANIGSGEWFGEWGLWIVVTMACYVPAFPMMAVMIGDGSVSLATPVVFAGWGAVVGLIQWFWLRRWVNGAGLWIAATAVGGAIFGVICLVADTSSGGLLSAALSAEESFETTIVGLAALLGTLFALSQWPLLRRWIPRASWWVAVTGVSWAAGFASFVFVGALEAGIGLESGVFVGLALVGWLVVPGALTGFVLVYLLAKKEIEELERVRMETRRSVLEKPGISHTELLRSVEGDRDDKKLVVRQLLDHGEMICKKRGRRRNYFAS